MGSGLHFTTAGRGTRLILVAGFTQTAACWSAVAADLAADHEVTTVDPPGHGGSEAARLGLWDGAAALGDSGGAGTYIGYSMGGRLCLHLALLRPDLVERLVLVGVSPGLVDPAERADRRRADAALAQRLETEGVARFVDDWLTNPLFTGLGPDSDCRAARYTNTVEGLASSLRLAGTGTQDDLWPRLRELTMPTLLVAGSLDHKFSEVGRHAAERIGPTASYASMPDAHHAAPFEHPQRFTLVLRAFLRSTT